MVKRGTTSTSSSTPGIRVAVLALLGTLACLPPEQHETKTLTSDAYLVNRELSRFADHLMAGRVAELVRAFPENFRLQGNRPADVEEWARYWQTFPGVLRVEVSQVDIDLPDAENTERLAPDGTRAQVAYMLEIFSCPSGGGQADGGVTSCELLYSRREFPGLPQSWFSFLEKRNGAWVPVGDRQPVGISLTSVHRGARYLLDARLRDPSRLLQGATLFGPGAPTGVPLSRSMSGDWTLPAEVVIANDPLNVPAVPITYSLELTTPTGPLELEGSVRGVVDEFAASLFPAGETSLPIVFRWEAIGSAPRRFQVRVVGPDGVIWQSSPTVETRQPYAGPELAAGVDHTFEVWTLDSHGNASVVSRSFVVLESADVTPELSTVTPLNGPAEGGNTVDIAGEGFLAGARVMFGEADATDVTVIDPGLIRCKAPPHVAGSVNVLVKNPSGRVGLLERGYTYQ